MKMDIGGLYFENRLCKSVNWFAKFEFADRLNQYGCEKYLAIT